MPGEVDPLEDRHARAEDPYQLLAMRSSNEVRKGAPSTTGEEEVSQEGGKKEGTIGDQVNSEGVRLL